MKIKIILGSIALVGLCQASNNMPGPSDERETNAGHPIKKSPPLRPLPDLSSEDLRNMKPFIISTISPRTEEQVQIDETAIRRAKGHGSVQ